MGQKYRHSNTSVTLINYHFVWIVRRRRKILEGKLDERVKELIFEAVNNIECEVIALETHLDHVHLFLNAPPTIEPAKIMHRVKGAVSHQIRKEFPWIKEKLPSFWTRSYFCSTAGNVSSATIKRYVEDQKAK